MSNIIIYPIRINHETEKAVLVSFNVFQGDVWLPKTQIVLKHGCVLAMAAWLYHKNKKWFRKSQCKTIEELEEWIEYEKDIARKMRADKTLRRCSRCGILFHSETYQYYCESCDLDHAINLQHSAKFCLAKNQMREAAHYGVAYEP
jgi:ribosomal protein S14